MYNLFGIPMMIISIVSLCGILFFYKKLSINAKQIFDSFIFKIKVCKALIITSLSIVKTKILNKNDILLKLNNTGLSATLVFNRLGKSYKLFLPYNKNKFNYMKNNRYYMVKNEIIEEFNHPSGIPLLISPSDMGVDKILVINENNSKKYEYTNNMIPNYFSEVEAPIAKRKPSFVH